VSVVPVATNGSAADSVAITNADKVWWPEDGITKLDIAT
jgi:hypothetical protein